MTDLRGFCLIGNVVENGFVGLCDWNRNRTVMLDVDWDLGTIGIK